MLNIKKVTPLFTSIITTMDLYKDDSYVPGTNIIDPSKEKRGVKEYQKVIAVGSSVREVKVGDIVCINPARYAVVKQRRTPNVAEEIESYSPAITGYNFNIVQIDGEDYLHLQENDIDLIINEYEEVPDPVPSPIVQGEKSELVLPN